jgi:P-loop containing region of AAA domain
MHSRILSFTVENFKKIRVVEVRPKGRVTKITGRNGQGKTSILDAFTALFEGKRAIPEKPVRRGAEKSKLTGILSDDQGRPWLIARRTISGDRTTNLTIEAAPGAERPAGTPQAVLDELIGAMTFDPVAFIGLDSKKQVEMLRQLVKLDIDIDDLNNATRLDYAERTVINRKVDELKALAAAAIYSPGLPKDKVDESAIVAKITEANDANRQIGARIAEKNRLAQVVSEMEKAAQLHAALIEEKAKFIIDADLAMIAATEQWEWFKSVFAALSDAHDDAPPRGSSDTLAVLNSLRSLLESVKAHADYAQSTILARKKEQEDAQQVLQAARALTHEVDQAVVDAREAWESAPDAEMVDTNELMAELQQAQLINREIDKRTRWEELNEQTRAKENESAQLTRNIEGREEKKRVALADAKMPLEGLTFNEEGVLFKGIPLQQLGEAEQIRVGCALAMAANPKLRCIPIARGESLDDQALEQIAQLAEQNDFQVFMAMVDTTGKTGIVLEDGMVVAVNE